MSIDVNQSKSIEKIEKGIIGSWITENYDKNNDQREKFYFFGCSGARYSPFHDFKLCHCQWLICR